MWSMLANCTLEVNKTGEMQLLVQGVRIDAFLNHRQPFAVSQDSFGNSKTDSHDDGHNGNQQGKDLWFHYPGKIHKTHFLRGNSTLQRQNSTKKIACWRVSYGHIREI